MSLYFSITIITSTMNMFSVRPPLPPAHPTTPPPHTAPQKAAPSKYLLYQGEPSKQIAFRRG